MVCALAAALMGAGLVYPLTRGGGAYLFRQTALATRWGIVVVLGLSGLLIVAGPRIDQPLLDAAEYLAPALREIYLREGEIRIHQDAGEHAERYRREAEQLNAREASSRAGGEVLDDTQVRRISSFLKSYGEMRRGEEFVMREVRSRARERVRWLGIPLILIALLMIPGLPTRLTDSIRGRRATTA